VALMGAPRVASRTRSNALGPPAPLFTYGPNNNKAKKLPRNRECNQQSKQVKLKTKALRQFKDREVAINTVWKFLKSQIGHKNVTGLSNPHLRIKALLGCLGSRRESYRKTILNLSNRSLESTSELTEILPRGPSKRVPSVQVPLQVRSETIHPDFEPIFDSFGAIWDPCRNPF